MAVENNPGRQTARQQHAKRRHAQEKGGERGARRRYNQEETRMRGGQRGYMLPPMRAGVRSVSVSRYENGNVSAVAEARRHHRHHQVRCVSARLFTFVVVFQTRLC